MSGIKRYVIYCNEEAYKVGGSSQLSSLEGMPRTQVRAFRKAHKLISWLEKRETQRPYYLLSTWREARPCIQAFAHQPHIVSIIKLIISCESSKQVHHVKRWISQQPVIPFAIEIAEDEEALAVLKEDLEKEDIEASMPHLSALALKMSQIPQPAKIKSDKGGRLVSTLPTVGTYSPQGIFQAVDSFDELHDRLLENTSTCEGYSIADSNKISFFASTCSNWSNFSQYR